MHPDDVEWVAERYRERGQGRRATPSSSTASSPPTAASCYLHDRMRVEVDGSGDVVSVRGVMVDVTDRKIAEQQMDQYLNLVERLAAGAVRVRR